MPSASSRRSINVDTKLLKGMPFSWCICAEESAIARASPPMEYYLNEPIHRRFLHPWVLTHHTSILYYSLHVHRRHFPESRQALRCKLSIFLLLVPHLLNNQREGPTSLFDNVFWLLSRQSRE